jgi:predicted site-specific integrase-resolvase
METTAEIRLYTPEQVAGLLQVSIQTIWKWDRQGRIHSINLAGNRMKRYRNKDIEDFLNGIEGGQEDEKNDESL